MTWTINYDNGIWADDQWVSRDIAWHAVKEMTTEKGDTLKLAYITEEEYNYLAERPVYNSGQVIMTSGVTYIGDRRIFALPKKGSQIILRPPMYWKSSRSHPVAKLYYLDTSQRRLLNELDLYGQDIKNNPHYGPYGIPSYQGNGVDIMGTGTIMYQKANLPYGKDAGVNVGSYGLINEMIANQINPQSGIYEGSLSSLGNMVAMLISDGDLFVEIRSSAQTNVRVGDRMTKAVWDTIVGSFDGSAVYVPHSAGYFRKYWRDPQNTTFGSNTAIPALTTVIPDDFKDLKGNRIANFTGLLPYYIDLQAQRITGGDDWDNRKFTQIISGVEAWVSDNNRATNMIIRGRKTLDYYGHEDYMDYVSKGWYKYLYGDAVKKAITNIGAYAYYINQGDIREGRWVGFGTSNSVIKMIIDNNLADIYSGTSSVADQVAALGANDLNMYDPQYTTAFDSILKKITNDVLLQEIQETIDSSIPNITSAYDFTDIAKCAGFTNDNPYFKTFIDIGIDMSTKHEAVVIQNGSQFIRVLESMPKPTDEEIAAINSLKGENGELISQTVLDRIKGLIPSTDAPVTMYDVVGTMAGKINYFLHEVNFGIGQLYASKYGTEIRDALTNISRTHSAQPGDDAEAADYSRWYAANSGQAQDPVTGDWYDVTPDVSIYWVPKEQAAKNYYFSLIAQVAADNTDGIQAIIKRINTNWTKCCQYVYHEWEIFNKGASSFPDGNYFVDSQYAGFVQSLRNYAKDYGNINMDLLLYNMTQENAAGERARTLLNYGKYEKAFSEINDIRADAP